jgi:ribonucleoside-diphosphate reductase alpha chain
MAIQFIPGYSQSQSPDQKQTELAMPGLLEELKKKVNRPVPDLPLADDASRERLLGTGHTNRLGNGSKGNGGNGHREIKTLSDAIAHFQEDAPTCPNCGHVAVRNGACYKCLNCGESLGCS